MSHWRSRARVWLHCRQLLSHLNRCARPARSQVQGKNAITLLGIPRKVIPVQVCTELMCWVQSVLTNVTVTVWTGVWAPSPPDGCSADLSAHSAVSVVFKMVKYQLSNVLSCTRHHVKIFLKAPWNNKHSCTKDSWFLSLRVCTYIFKVLSLCCSHTLGITYLHRRP